MHKHVLKIRKYVFLNIINYFVNKVIVAMRSPSIMPSFTLSLTGADRFNIILADPCGFWPAHDPFIFTFLAYPHVILIHWEVSQNLSMAGDLKSLMADKSNSHCFLFFTSTTRSHDLTVSGLLFHYSS